MQEFGITAPDVATAESTVREFIVRADPAQADNIDVAFEEISTLTMAEAEREFLSDREMGAALIGNPADEGIWYRTGCGFYDR